MDIGAMFAGLDGLSLFIGAAVGLLVGALSVLASRFSMKRTFNQALEKQKSAFDESLGAAKSAYETVANSMKSSFDSLSNEALLRNQQDFLELAKGRFEDQEKQHGTTLENKKELIDQQLQSMSKSMTETLGTVPTNLEKNQNKVAEVLDRSTKDLKDSNQVFLSQISDKAAAQTKEHFSKLDDKETQINRRLGEMDQKLDKVQTLINEFEKAREGKLGALDDQLKNLTQTTSSLQKALADNRARGQWGERMAEDMLNFMGLVEGVNYIKQSALDAGTRPDFTFLFPNQKSLNMDAKFPLDNYLRYIEAENDAERKEYSQKFLRDVNQRVVEIQKRDYIATGTLDCVLIFIPNEQVYRFIYEEDQTIIDNALKQKVIMCSPLTLYIVLAVIRQAAQNFNIEQRSREIIDVVNDIRAEWEKYTGQMDKLERRFKGMHEDFHTLTGTRTRQMDRKFVKIDSVTKSNEFSSGDAVELPQLPEQTT